MILHSSDKFFIWKFRASNSDRVNMLEIREIKVEEGNICCDIAEKMFNKTNVSKLISPTWYFNSETINHGKSENLWQPPQSHL